VAHRLARLSSLLVPPLCGLCGTPCDPRSPICERCDARLRAAVPGPSAVPGVDVTWSAASYEGIARDLIAAVKFGGRLAPVRRAAAAMAAAAPAGMLDGTIVPVPPDPMRRRRRGFDVAHELASALAIETGLPADPCLRRSWGRRQVGRSRLERLADPPAVRLARRGVPPVLAVLVDDVVTTGGTLSACARALRSAGSSSIAAVTFARAAVRRPSG
jgi:predicted amidophosphoribosyltransferase